MDRQEASGGYYRHPTVHDERVVFVSEDDLWEVPVDGGRAQRLTTGRGRMRDPAFSPDGSRIAFTGSEEGAREVYVMDAGGGPADQLTFNGSVARVVGWTPDGERILFRSVFREPFSRGYKLYSVARDGGEVRREQLGVVHGLDFAPDGDGRVLARHSDDLARWKRYRGGTVGTLWIDRSGEGDWEPLLPDCDAGTVRPMWVGDRIFFLSDIDGFGNLYSCDPEGENLTRHTDHSGFYARFAASDGETIVYTRGGALWRFDPNAGEGEQLELDYPSPRTHLNRKFVDASEYLEEYDIHPAGHSLAVTVRGKLFNFGHWEGGVRQNGARHGVRYRLPQYLDDEHLLAVSDEGREPTFDILPVEGGTERSSLDLDDEELGRPTRLEVDADGEHVAFANHRNELYCVELESGEVEKLDTSEHGPIAGIDWSPDGNWIAYSLPTGSRTSGIRVADRRSGETHEVTDGRFRDTEPVFDPEGRYLYFLSCRTFNPVYDQFFFELSFPRTMKPCVATLQEDEPSPFAEQPRPLEGTGGPPSRAEESDEDEASDGEADDDASDEESDEEDPLAIDFDGMSDRIETFPVREAEYRGLDATESRVFWMMHPIEGSLGDHWSDDRGSGGRLQYFSLDDLDDDTFAKKVESFRIGPDGATMAMEAQGKLRVVDATGRAPAKQSEGDQRPNRESGWIDLDRVTAAVRPRREWEQMLHEAWRLMEAYYWREDMGGVDWEDVWDRYSELLDRVSTRSEFSDLVWVMQGELGTSHAYEMGGDYEHPPQYRPGYLGADVEWDDDAFYVEEDEERTGAFRLEHIVDGSSWEDGADSPLNAPGLGIETGDLVVGVNGERFDGGASLQEALVHRSGDEVELTVASDGDEVETETVDLLHSEREARYREWVQNNRDRVHEATDGEIGYVHIPDMGPRGFSEFHRAFASERERTGLIVDVRFNGGGHVSQLILEKLAREPIGYDRPRWHESEPYPHGAIQGPMVAIANEYAGSDGDIFSHCFKLMDLGPVVGKRTWGGVVGIWPRHRLVDRSVTTQPEFASWFRDVGFGLENRGTEPDIEVEVPPGEMVEDDPQLERAIEEALERLEADPPEMPDLEPDTDLAPPDELD